MSHELARKVVTQIYEILDSANWPEAEVEAGPKIRPEIRRFEVGNGFINRAFIALSVIPEFKKEDDTYFKESTDKEVSFTLGENLKYKVYYFKGVEQGRPNVKKEEFYLIKNGTEKITITSFYLDNQPLNCHISYSNNSPNFTESTHYGSPESEADCDRLITELELASE